MVRHLKTLGLSVVALVTMISASASSAAATQFHAESGPSFYEGSQVETTELKVETGITKCTKMTLSGTQANATDSTAEVHPSYSGCKAFGVTMAVNTTGCNYLLHVEGGTTADVVCSGGNKITISPTGLECTVTVGSQTGLEGVTLSNIGSGSTRGITAGLNMKNIEYTETGASCAAAGNHANGTYTGSVAVSGYADNSGVKGVQRGIWVE